MNTPWNAAESRQRAYRAYKPVKPVEPDVKELPSTGGFVINGGPVMSYAGYQQARREDKRCIVCKYNQCSCARLREIKAAKAPPVEPKVGPSLLKPAVNLRDELKDEILRKLEIQRKARADAPQIYQAVAKSVGKGHFFHDIPPNKVIGLIEKKLIESGGMRPSWGAGELEALLPDDHPKHQTRNGFCPRCTFGNVALSKGGICKDTGACDQRLSAQINAQSLNSNNIFQEQSENARLNAQMRRRW